jgi:hypothetical protein
VARSRVQTVGSVALWLSLLTFCIFFLNVLFGGPLGRKPWMSDVAEMLTLFVAVALFVVGTIAREMQARQARGDARAGAEDGPTTD